jgi:hypothetical protein
VRRGHWIRFRREPKNSLLDFISALIVLVIWGAAFLVSIIVGSRLGLPGWGVWIFVAFCMLVVIVVTFIPPFLRRGAGSVLSNAHGVNIDPPNC